MKRLEVLLFAMLLLILPSFSQETFYLYKHNGEVNQFLISHVKSIEQSKIGVDGLEYDDYVTQEIITIDSVSRIQLSMVDSIGFSTPDPTKSISEAYVSIDWSNTDLLLFDPVNGNFSLYCKTEIPNIKQESVIVIETDTASCVVLVTDVSKLDRRLDIKGELGDISYLFFDTEFTLTTDKNSTADSPYQYKYLRSLRRGIEVEDDGTIRATGTLWKTPTEEQTNIFYEKGYTQAYTKSKFGMNLDYEVKLRFGDKKAIEKNGMRFFSAKNLYVDANLNGTMDAYYDFYLDINKDEDNIDLAPEKIEKYEILKHKLFPTIPLKFTIGIVPVTIDLGADLFADVSLKAGGELHFTAGIGASANTLIGVRYDEKKTDNLESYKEEPKLAVTPHNPTVSGKGKISGKVHLFPRIHAWIYGVSGPSLDIKPYLRAELSGGFKKDMLQDASSDFCAWSLKTDCGLDLAAGISVSNWNYEVWNKSTPDLKVLEYNLYNSPIEIQMLSASPDKISKDESTLVTFEVFDKGFDGKNVLTPLPQLVKFEGRGEINSTAGLYGVANSGHVTATWIPSSATDTLYARLYDIDGNIIAEAQYSKENEIPVSISSVTTTAAQYRPTDHPQHFIYKDSSYEFKYDVATVVKLADDEGVENWGYVYEGPYEGDKKSRISLKGAPYEYEDMRFAYYRNGSPTEHTARLYPFVKYTGDDEYYYGEPVDYPLVYPDTSTVELTGCSTGDVVTRENAEYNGVTYDYCSTFILDYNATGAYWITVGAEETGDGWNGWDNNLPAREHARATDGSNRLTINYYYNQKVLKGDYILRIKGSDTQHNTSCTSSRSVRLKHNGKSFTGCELIQ